MPLLWSLTHVHVSFSNDITCDVFSSLLMQTIPFSPQLSGHETELRWIMSMLFFCLRPQVPINKADTRPGHGDGSELKKDTRPGFDNDKQNCS